MKKRLLASFLLFIALRAGADERWYVFSIGETPVGYVSEETDGSRTRTIVFAKLTRLGSSVEMKFDTTTVENADGELQTLAFEALMSKQPSRFDVVIDRDRVRITAAGNERVLERGAAPILGPRAIVRKTKALASIGDAFDYVTFAPELQRVVRARRTVLAIDDAACSGVRGIKIEEKIEGMPMARTLWIDSDGNTAADSVAGPFGPMKSCRATRETALTARGDLPADLYERTLARSNVRLAEASAIDRMVVRVTPRDASQPLPSFATHNQRVLEKNTVEIRRNGGPGTAAAEDLDANALIESKNESIVQTAREIAPDAKPRELADALTAWVAKHMTMDTGIMMAPASELIRDRRGTCIGYATLLASLARARNIPARVAMGYVYVGGIWGGHAWTEMLFDGRWHSYDAAVYAPGVASATRLAVGASSLADGGADLNTALGLLFGRVELEIVEYEIAGQVTRVPRGQQAWRVEGSRYINPGLGIDFDAAGWTIERADSTWPSTLVVAFRRGTSTIEVHEKR